MTSLATSTVVLSASMAVAAGLIGSFALMRRMALAADALSHVALPGIGVALLLRVHPLLGASTALLGGAILIWILEHRTRLATETIIGVVFSAALAIGALLTTNEELIDALLGEVGKLAPWELPVGVAGAALVIAFVLVARDRLIVTLVSGDMARAAGIKVDRLRLLFLIAFALTVALGLRYLGVLLMGSLLIIPPATARQLARNLTEMLWFAAIGAVVATLAGTWLAVRLHRESGPLIVVVAAACFFLSLVVRRR